MDRACRRATLPTVLDPRIYRAAFLPALLALVVAAFSLQEPPAPLTTTLAPDAFDGARAPSATLDGAGRRVAAAREPGSRRRCRLADARAQRRCARAASASRRGASRRRRPTASRRSCETVVGERAGFSERRIVVVAHRDALGRPATAQLSGTAALLELARVLRGRTLRKTLVLASTSGGSAGARGRDARWRGTWRTRRRRARARRPGRRRGSPPAGRAVVQRPRPRPARAAAHGRGALRLEGGLRPGRRRRSRSSRGSRSRSRSASRAPFVARGFPAVLRVGERRARSRRRARRVARALADLRRAALRTISALDARPGATPPSRGRGLRREQGAAGVGGAPADGALHAARAARRDRRVSRACAAAGSPWACGWAGCSRRPFPSPRPWRLPSSCVTGLCRRRRPGRRRRAPYRVDAAALVVMGAVAACPGRGSGAVRPLVCAVGRARRSGRRPALPPPWCSCSWVRRRGLGREPVRRRAAAAGAAPVAARAAPEMRMPARRRALAVGALTLLPALFSRSTSCALGSARPAWCGTCCCSRSAAAPLLAALVRGASCSAASPLWSP